jgi:hypothetical protein
MLQSLMDAMAPRQSRKFQDGPPDQLRPLVMAQPQDRAGGYTIEQLQALLAPVLEQPAHPERKWPLAYGFALAGALSLALWAIAILGLSRLF